MSGWSALIYRERQVRNSEFVQLLRAAKAKEKDFKQFFMKLREQGE